MNRVRKERAPASEETRLKHRMRMLKNNPMKGKFGVESPRYNKPWSTESRQKLSKSRTGLKTSVRSKFLGTKQSEDFKKKVSEGLKKKRAAGWKPLHYKASIATRLKMSNSQKNRIFTPEHKAKLKLARARQILPFKDSKLEQAIEKKLVENNIPFTKHARLKGTPDFLVDNKICVFVDGNYWHANPLLFAPDVYIARGRTAKDVWFYDLEVNRILCKDKYIVLRLWESDITNNIDSCINKIQLERVML